MPCMRALAAAITTLLLVSFTVAGPVAAEESSPEPLIVPETLDRAFDDTDESLADREALVSSQVEPWITDDAVLAAMRAVPRHAFVPTEHLALAYGDHPLPIGYGQTISQPSLVAYMTELLDVEPGDRVLEIGTGSGYQAAVLAELTDEVYSIEIVPELAGVARAVLDALGYEDEVDIRRGDGYFGWEDAAPFARHHRDRRARPPAPAAGRASWSPRVGAWSSPSAPSVTCRCCGW